MIKTHRNIFAGVIGVALAQSLVLGWMVFDRVQLLRTGREIVLKIVPVDPRSLFRGDYVRLAYPISTVPAALMAQHRKGNAPVYVTLERGSDGGWKAISVNARYEPQTAANRIVLRARSGGRRFLRQTRTATVRLRYGIERYFVQEGKGLKLENLARKKQLKAVIAVDRAGNAAIKGLMIDGKLQYEEPLL